MRTGKKKRDDKENAGNGVKGKRDGKKKGSPV